MQCYFHDYVMLYKTLSQHTGAKDYLAGLEEVMVPYFDRAYRENHVTRNSK